MANKNIKFIVVLIVVGLIGIIAGQKLSNTMIENAKQYCKLKDYGISVFKEPSILSDKIDEVNVKDELEIIGKIDIGEAKAGIMTKSYTLTDKDGNRYQLKDGDKFKILSTDSVGDNRKIYSVEVETDSGKIITEKISSNYLLPFQEGKWVYLKTKTGNKFWAQEEDIRTL